MDICVLFSGGKDSTYAAYLVKKAGHNLKCLLSFYSKNPESYMFHYSNIGLTKLQAGLMGVRHIAVETEGKKEEELKDIKNALEPLDIDAVVSGAQASRYQKSRIDSICRGLGLKSISPLWGKNPVQLLRDEKMYGFKTIITSISAEGLDETWLGREIDAQCIADLETLNKNYGIHVGFEGGEAESFVLDCPLFNGKIEIIDAVKKMYGPNRGILEIKNVKFWIKHEERSFRGFFSQQFFSLDIPPNVFGAFCNLIFPFE